MYVISLNFLKCGLFNNSASKRLVTLCCNVSWTFLSLPLVMTHLSLELCLGQVPPHHALCPHQVCGGNSISQFDNQRRWKVGAQSQVCGGNSISQFDNQRRWKVGAQSNILFLTDFQVGNDILKNRYPKLFSNLVLKEGPVDKYGVRHGYDKQNGEEIGFYLKLQMPLWMN